MLLKAFGRVSFIETSTSYKRSMAARFSFRRKGSHPRRRNTIIVALCACVVLGSTDVRADITASDLAKIVGAAQKSSGVPGLAAVLVDGPQIIGAAGGVRAAAPSLPVKVRPNDMFDLASCFKAIFATIVARLAEKRQIGWNTTISQVFPELKSRMDPAYRNVTVAQLLAHRGRIRDYIGGLDEAVQRFQGTHRAARLHFLPTILKAAPAGSPGGFYYSSYGYAVAGAMIERLLDEDFESIMQRELVTPLAIPSVTFGIAGSNDPDVIDQPRPHNAKGKPLLPSVINRVRVIDDMAGVYSMTMNDWARVVQVHLGVLPQGKQYLTKASLKTLHTPVGQIGDRYALGWDVATSKGQTVLSHDGSNAVMYTRAVLNLATARAIILAANQDGPGFKAIRTITSDPKIVAWLRGTP